MDLVTSPPKKRKIRFGMRKSEGQGQAKICLFVVYYCVFPGPRTQTSIIF